MSFPASETCDWVSVPESTGTSILAAEFDEGVVIGADSRTTLHTYVSNRVTDKLTKITDHIYCCRSGSSADTQAIADAVAFQMEFHRLELGEEPLVKTAAAMFREMCYKNRDYLNAGVIIAGWDRCEGGQVYSVPIGGMCIRQQVGVGGSGSTYVYGFLDSNFKPYMDQEECADFVTNYLTLAMSRDGASGGVVRLGIITENGIERRVVLGNELPQYFNE